MPKRHVLATNTEIVFPPIWNKEMRSLDDFRMSRSVTCELRAMSSKLIIMHIVEVRESVSSLNCWIIRAVAFSRLSSRDCLLFTIRSIQSATRVNWDSRFNWEHYEYWQWQQSLSSKLELDLEQYGRKLYIIVKLNQSLIML